MIVDSVSWGCVMLCLFVIFCLYSHFPHLWVNEVVEAQDYVDAYRKFIWWLQAVDKDLWVETSCLWIINGWVLLIKWISLMLVGVVWWAGDPSSVTSCYHCVQQTIYWMKLLVLWACIYGLTFPVCLIAVRPVHFFCVSWSSSVRCWVGQ